MSSNNLILGPGILLKNSSDGNTTLTLVSDVPVRNNDFVGNTGTSSGNTFLYSNIIISPEILNPVSNQITESSGPTGPSDSSVITGITLVNPSNLKTKISLVEEPVGYKDTEIPASGIPEAFSIVGPGLNIVNNTKGETSISLVIPEPTITSSKNNTSSICGPCNPCPPVVPTPFASALFSTIQLGNPSQGTQVTISTDGINLYLKPSGGNLYTGWTGTIIGSGGGGGTGYTGPTGPGGSSDYQICPPPFQFGTPRSTAANIYIPIIYPDQKYVGDFPQPVPTIQSTILDLSYINGSDTTISGTILNTGDIPFDSRYQNGLSSSSRSKPYNNHPLEGIILNNSIEDPKTNPVKPIPQNNTFYYINNNTSYQVWSIIYYINNPKISSTGNSMTGTYTNYSDCIVPGGVIFDGFLPPTPPSNDARYDPEPSGYTDLGYNRIKLSILPPSDPDLGDNPGVFIKRYTSTYYTTGSTIRYGGPVSQGSAGSPLSQIVQFLSNSGTPFSTIDNIGIYPDCQYTFNLTSTNSIGGTSALCYGPGGGAGPTEPNYPTIYLPMLIYPTSGPNSLNISDYSSPSDFFSTPFVSNAYLVSNRTQITNLFNKTAIVTNSLGAFSINYDPNTRGIYGSAKTLMNISTNTSTSSTIDYSTNQNYQSFPLNVPISSGNDLILNSSSTSDQYSTSIAAYQGFYSKMTVNNITLLIDRYPASNIRRTFNAIQKYYQVDGITLANTYSTSHPFYYDRVVGVPTPVTSAASPTSTTVFVSGVSISGTNPTFTVNVSAGNMGDYFYPSPIIRYSFSGGAVGTFYETNLSNVTSSLSGGIFTNPVTFTNNSLSPIISGSFSSSIQLNVTAYNIVGQSSSVASTLSQQGIFDLPSYNLVYVSGNIPTSIQDIIVTTSDPDPIYPVALGCRVWSAPSSTLVNKTGNTPAPGTANVMPPAYGLTVGSNLYSYSQFIYNQEWNISSTVTSITTPVSTTIDTSNELQIFNGAYQSAANIPYTAGSVGGYLDYTPYYNNSTVDYSNLPDGGLQYRYGTFVWNFPGSPKIVAFRSTLTFTFKNFKCRDLPATVARDNSSGSYHISNNGNTQKIFFHYRVEEYDNSTIYVNPIDSNNKFTTIWIDGNSGFGSTNSSGTAVLSSSSINPAAVDRGNCNDPINNSTVRFASAVTMNMIGTDLVIAVSNIIFYTINTDKCYVYCRIGLPMIDNYSFEYVTLQITQ